MEKIDYEIDDFMNYCDYNNLSKKSMKSYEQTLRLFVKYLTDRDEKEEHKSKITRTEQVQEIWEWISTICMTTDLLRLTQWKTLKQ